MAPSMKDLGIDQLALEDRFALAREILDTLGAEDRLELLADILTAAEEIPLTDSQKELLDRRIADLEANPQNVLTWEQIKEHVI